ncbi:MAG: hypothetical protein PHN42_03650 [Bacilli bacterium]|nr:hypothetical protein [Bacilli bacterium]
MKNEIQYYYGIIADNIRLSNDNYEFVSNEQYYVLYRCEETYNLEKIYNINQLLINQNIYNHIIVKNINNQIITIINNKNYVLMKMYDDMKKKITLEDIIKFNYITTSLQKENVNWKNLWSNKIDYFEQQVNQAGIKYPLIRESISYYIGLAETAISLMNQINKVSFCICHRRINKDSTFFDLFNPFNLIFDTKVRDVCEYFKSLFFNKESDKEKIILYILNYLKSSNLDIEEIQLFFIRMLYHTPYFDLYEKIIDQSIEETEITTIINSNLEYEKIIKDIYIYIRKKNILPEIEWIKKI